MFQAKANRCPRRHDDSTQGHRAEKLAGVDARLVRVVECRYCTGLSVSDTAAALGVPVRTTPRAWVKARAWLRLVPASPP